MNADFLDAHAECRRYLHRQTRARIVATALGLKTVGAQRLPEVSIQVFVATKIPKCGLLRAERIPASFDGIPIDIVENPPAVFSGASTSDPRVVARVGRSKYRPLQAGVSCANLYSSGGTLGAFCEGLNREGRPARFILGCGHVLRGRESYKATRAVIQASSADGGTSRDTVALFDRDLPLHPDPDRANCCDAAVAELLPGVESTDDIVGIGKLTGRCEPTLGMRVIKSGRTTGITTGLITSVDLDTSIPWSIRDPHLRYRFTNLIRIESETPGVPFSLPGDSGALIVTAEDRRAAALYFAGGDDGSFGLAAPITAVEEALKIRLNGIAQSIAPIAGNTAARS